MSIVVDASVAVLPATAREDPRSGQARALLVESHDRGVLRAPAVLAWEVGNVMHRKEKGAIPGDVAARARVTSMIVGLFELVVPDSDALQRIGEIAERASLTFYDASYVELAARDDVGVLVTEDRQLLRRARDELGQDRAFDVELGAFAVEQGLV